MIFEPDDRVMVSYTGYRLLCAVICDPAPAPFGMGSYGSSLGANWLLVEQITDFEDRDPGDRPQFEVAREYVVAEGETPARGPFE